MYDLSFWIPKRRSRRPVSYLANRTEELPGDTILRLSIRLSKADMTRYTRPTCATNNLNRLVGEERDFATYKSTWHGSTCGASKQANVRLQGKKSS